MNGPYWKDDVAVVVVVVVDCLLIMSIVPFTMPNQWSEY